VAWTGEQTRVSHRRGRRFARLPRLGRLRLDCRQEVEPLLVGSAGGLGGREARLEAAGEGAAKQTLRLENPELLERVGPTVGDLRHQTKVEVARLGFRVSLTQRGGDPAILPGRGLRRHGQGGVCT